MRPKKTRKTFVLYRKKTNAGPVWYARYWNEASRRYTVTRSTGIPVEGKRQRRYEAELIARELLPSIHFAPDKTEIFFTQYVADFWRPDSAYVKEWALVKKRPLFVDYVAMNHENVRRHMESFPGFHGLSLRGLTTGIIKDWMVWAASNGRTGRSINASLQAMRVAVKHAVLREDLTRDPFMNIKNAAENHREKGILSLAEVSRLVAAPVRDPWARLAVLLGILCGLRRGEVRGLQWGDIENGIITVRHNYQESEGNKTPKYGSKRQVPIPKSVQSALDAVFAMTDKPGPEDFIMAGPLLAKKPLSTKYFERALTSELSSIGIPGKWEGKGEIPEGYVNEQRRRNLTFHGLRHTFVTLGRLAGITDLEIQSLAGHKSAKMMDRYSHAAQVLDFAAAKEKLERAVGG